ncbi:MAG: hypothetical protein PHC98_01895 [Syntrophotalea acetylenica]|nr:hypothetical protein [Syntrophotalea acetylenica]
MPFFKKKPIIIEAEQWNGSSLNDAKILYKKLGAVINPVINQNGSLIIPTLEGEHEARKGDWIIRGVASEFYPCKPDIFDATYEKV